MSNDSDSEQGFLSRWSRRKHESGKETELIEQNDESSVDLNVEPIADELSSESPSEAIEDEAEELHIWQQADADPQEKTAALRALFRQPEFNEIDRLNDYDQDFSQYTSLKGVVTAQMKRMIKLAEEKTRPDQQADEIESAPEISPDLSAELQDAEISDLSDSNDHKEDKPLA